MSFGGIFNYNVKKNKKRYGTGLKKSMKKLSSMRNMINKKAKNSHLQVKYVEKDNKAGRLINKKMGDIDVL